MTQSSNSMYDRDLDANPANHAALSPISFIARAARIHPEAPAVVYEDVRRNWGETYTRTRRLAGGLAAHGVKRGDTVSLIAANIPEHVEAHFGVPMTGAVLNSINTRLDAATIAFILEHAETKVFIVDPEFSAVAAEALERTGNKDILVVAIVDPHMPADVAVGALTYEELLEHGAPDFAWHLPADEWDAIALGYTSGTTGNPKGVVTHHRGAYLNALAHIVDWTMPQHARYLWTLPMFHCNGWCFPWTIAAIAGVNICLRGVRDEPIYRLIRDEKVSHFCGAPIVLNMLANAPDAMKDFDHEVKVMTAGASPPAAVIGAMETMGIHVTHVYGLTEVYGPSVISVWKDEWNDLPAYERARLKSRQGVNNTALENVMVADPDTLEPLPHDGETIGEIFMRGNNVMKGYLKNPQATQAVFRGGWFATGDLGVTHPDGYVQIKDRSKDIIISGGENISSVEIEDVLYRHPAVMEAAVVAKADGKWGEVPCAFVDLKPGAEVSAEDIIGFCGEHLARFKRPKSVIFGPLPKTSTGKVQKFELRGRTAGETG